MLTSGSATDGTYSGTVTIPRFSPHGDWTADVVVVDKVKNSHDYVASELSGQGWDSAFEQQGPGDGAPPALTDFSFTPTSGDTSSADVQIQVSAHITDDLTGVDYAYARFNGPNQSVQGPNFVLTSGSATAIPTLEPLPFLNSAPTATGPQTSRSSTRSRTHTTTWLGAERARWDSVFQNGP